MSEKSYVSMGQKICSVCGQAYDDGSILLDKRLRDSMERHTTTGWGMCPEHQKLKDDGFVALIGVDEKKSSIAKSDTIVMQENAFRTGRMAHLKIKPFEGIFNQPAPEGMVAFVPDGVLDMLQAMQEQQNMEDHPNNESENDENDN